MLVSRAFILHACAPFSSPRAIAKLCLFDLLACAGRFSTPTEPQARLLMLANAQRQYRMLQAACVPVVDSYATTGLATTASFVTSNLLILTHSPLSNTTLRIIICTDLGITHHTKATVDVDVLL